MRWTIYYGDGTTVSSDTGPEDVPKRDVQVIVQADPGSQSGYSICHSNDFYTWRDDLWVGADQFGMFDFVFGDTGHRVALAGRSMRDGAFADLLKLASDNAKADIY
jgi:hypothetical protein